MTVPDTFIGGWVRVGLALDGGPEHETADVIWLQDDEVFVDLRIDRSSGAVVGCCAGVTSWMAPHLWWTRTLDMADDLPEDLGRVRWDDDDLIEEGVFPFPGSDGPVPYLERWRRLPDSRPVRSVVGEGSITVEAGAYELRVSRTAVGVTARYRKRDIDSDSGAWVVVHEVRDGVVVPVAAS